MRALARDYWAARDAASRASDYYARRVAFFVAHGLRVCPEHVAGYRDTAADVHDLADAASAALDRT
jgi:hypothetical protein